MVQVRNPQTYGTLVFRREAVYVRKVHQARQVDEMTTAVREILAWELKPGMRVRNPDNHETRRVDFVGSQTNRYGKRPVFFRDDREPWWVGSFTEVEIEEVAG